MVFRLKTAFSFSVCSFVTLSAPVREHSWCLRLRPGSWWNTVWQMVPLSTLPASLGRSVVCGTGPSLSSPFHEWKLAWKSLFTVSPMCVCVCVCTAGKLWPGKLQCIQGRCYVYDSNVCQGVGKVRAGWFHLLLTSLSLSLSLSLFSPVLHFPCVSLLFISLSLDSPFLLLRHGIRCNAILPGFISTQMTDAIPEPVREQVRCRT